MLESGKANVVIGGQFGSEGKGKLYGYLYEKEKIDVCVCDFSPNAGHTAYVNGRKVVSKVLPLGAWYGVPTVCIGPHATFNVQRLIHEIEDVRENGHPAFMPLIHPLACVVNPHDVELEKVGLNAISSTMQGGAEAVIRKMRRATQGAALACNEAALQPFICDTTATVNRMVSDGATCLIETAQGYDLGLNNGLAWPYVTSRDCLVGRVLDNAGVNVRQVGEVIGVLRTFPIRVGNTEGGFSGPCYNDQREMTWEEISDIRGVPTIEHTTVTKRVRRVFSFSWQQLERFCRAVGPTQIVLNFADYLPPDRLGPMLSILTGEGDKLGYTLSLIGRGPLASDYLTWGGLQ